MAAASNIRAIGVGVVAVLFAGGAGCNSCGVDSGPRLRAAPEAGTPVAPRYAVPAPKAPPAAVAKGSIGRGPAPVYPTPVPLTLAEGVTPLDPPLRVQTVLPIEGRPLAVVSGVSADGLVIELIDIDRGLVLWRDTSCAAPAVHTTPDRIVCAGWKGIRGISVDDGAELWSSPLMFRAAHERFVLARDIEDDKTAAIIDAQTGKVVLQLVAPAGETFDEARRVCAADTGFDVYSWSMGGQLRRIYYRRVRANASTGRRVWTRRLRRPPAKTDLCDRIPLLEVPIPGSDERTLHALSYRSGKDVARSMSVLGWWRADPQNGGKKGGIETSTAAGIQARKRTLEQRAVVLEGRVAGRSVATWHGLRLVRSVGDTLALLDHGAVRAWLAAPTRVHRAVITGNRLIAGPWLSPPKSGAENILLYELPTASGGDVAVPMSPPSPPRVVEPPPQRVPPRPTWKPATYQQPGAGDHGVTQVALKDGRVYAVELGRRPSKSYGAGIAAFDLAKRAWLWHTKAACAPNAAVVGIAIANDVVVCAAAQNAPGAGHVWALDRATGKVRWRKKLPTVDRIVAEGSAVVAIYGEHAAVFAASTGDVVYEFESDNGHLPRVVARTLPASVGGGSRVIAVESSGMLVARDPARDGVSTWALRVNGYVRRLSVFADGVVVQLSSGELYVVNAASGEAQLLPYWSPSWYTASGSDLAVDMPAASEGVSMIRAFDSSGTELFRSALAITPPLRQASLREPGAALVFVSNRAEGRIIDIEPRTGRVRGSYRVPSGMVLGSVFSSVATGKPAVGAVLQKPLAVVIF